MTAPAPAPVSARDLVLDTWAYCAGVLHRGRLGEVDGACRPVAQARRLAGCGQP